VGGNGIVHHRLCVLVFAGVVPNSSAFIPRNCPSTHNMHTSTLTRTRPSTHNLHTSTHVHMCRHNRVCVQAEVPLILKEFSRCGDILQWGTYGQPQSNFLHIQVWTSMDRLGGICWAYWLPFVSVYCRSCRCTVIYCSLIRVSALSFIVASFVSVHCRCQSLHCRCQSLHCHCTVIVSHWRGLVQRTTHL